MPLYKLSAAGAGQQQAPAAGQRPVSAPGSPEPAAPRLSRIQYLRGLLRLLRRAAAVRAAASGRLMDEQEERQLRLLRISSPPSGSGR